MHFTGVEFADRVLLEIRLGENAALVAARLDDRVGGRALVEGVGAVLGDAGERRGEVGLDQPVADGKGLAVGLEEDGGRCRVA